MLRATQGATWLSWLAACPRFPRRSRPQPSALFARTLARRVVAVSAFGVLGCDDAPAPTAAPTPSAAPAAAKTAVAKPKAAPKPVAKEPTPLQLTDADFVDSIERNRDPFRSYLREFATPLRRTVAVQRKVLLQRYALDELRLIAVVSGRVRARAMFRDPTGLGVSVKRGDYISKSAARVKQILPDRVVVQLEERTENQQRNADRVIALHAKAEREGRR